MKYLKNNYSINLNPLQNFIVNLITVRTGKYFEHYWDYFFKFNTNKDLTILEIGAGNGWLINTNHKNISKKIVIDRDDEYSNTLDVDLFLKQDFEKGTNLKSHSCDVIIMNHVFEHMSNYMFVLSELKRLLRHDGIIIIKVPDIKKVKFMFYEDYTHVKAYTKVSLRRLFLDNGFNILKCENFSHNRFMIDKLIRLNYYKGRELILIASKGD